MKNRAPARHVRDHLRLCAAPLLLVSLLLALHPPTSRAVIIATGDGTGNTSAPNDDPGWNNVGTRGGLTVVYLGNRWVVTANHVGLGDVILGGVLYNAIAGSTVRMQNADASLADLIVFRLLQDPGLPALQIGSSTPTLNQSLTLIGHGRNRGAATTWSGLDGWLWGAGATMRWGTNKVYSVSEQVFNTTAFSTRFDQLVNPPTGNHEAQAATGDSGGAAFAKTAGNWKLVGTLFAIANYVNQPANTALYGDLSYAADLTNYRNQILAVIDQPSCSDGLDDDADGLTDFPADPGCRSALDSSEREAGHACDDGLDNDRDGGIDYPGDAECLSPADASELSGPPTIPFLGTGARTGLLALLLVLGVRAAQCTVWRPTRC